VIWHLAAVINTVTEQMIKRNLFITFLYQSPDNLRANLFA